MRWPISDIDFSSEILSLLIEALMKLELLKDS